MMAIMQRSDFTEGQVASDEPVLAGFDPRLRSAARLWQRPPGTMLFRVGDRPTWLFYVRTGEVLLSRVTPSGAPVVLQRTSDGFVAEASLTSTSYHCEAVCRTHCELLALPVADLRAAIDSDSGSRWAWVELLGTHLRRQRLRIERLTLKTVRDRLAHLLASESHADGGYELRGTRMDLALEIGVTPAALYRELAVLQAENLLSIDGARWFWRG